MPIRPIALCLACSLSAFYAVADEVTAAAKTSPLIKKTDNQTAKHRWLRLNLGISLARGGDDLGYVKFEDGRGGKISAGHGSSADIGVYLDIKDAPINFLINVGFKGRHRKGENTLDGEVFEGKATMERIYLDGIALYQPHRHHRFGLGFSTHMATELVIDTGFFKERRDYKTALGYLIQYEYIFTSKGKSIPSLGLRYYAMEYEEDKIISNRVLSKQKIDASNTALFVNYTF